LFAKLSICVFDPWLQRGIELGRAARIQRRHGCGNVVVPVIAARIDDHVATARVDDRERPGRLQHTQVAGRCAASRNVLHDDCEVPDQAIGRQPCRDARM
jgi:hypothetical protein